MSRLTRIHETARREGEISRRTLLGWSAALAALPALNGRTEGAVLRSFRFTGDPFTLGVASGDPTDSGVVLWTKLAPNPLEPGGGMPANAAVEVAWEIATDDAMRNVVQRGTAVATPQLGHTVHVEAEGLQPDHWYWYRFRAGDATSKVGRARTMPAADSNPDQLKFAFASCAHYETGFFTRLWPDGPRGSRPHRSPRRLYLRGRWDRQQGSQACWERDRVARRLPDQALAVQT